MPDRENGFVFVPERCVQCHACATACRIWRDTERDAPFRRIEWRWSGAYPDVALRTVSVACLHCVAPACVAACPSGALAKRAEDGAVLVDRDLCTGCRTCADACPYDVPRFVADGTMAKCDLCAGSPELREDGAPPCVRTCPTGALGWALRSVEEKRREEAAVLALLGRGAGRP